MRRRWEVLMAHDGDLPGVTARLSKSARCDDESFHLLSTRASDKHKQLTSKRTDYSARLLGLEKWKQGRGLTNETETDACHPPHGDGDICLLLIKHRLLTYFVERVYTMFDREWKSTTETGPASSEPSSRKKNGQSVQSTKRRVEHNVARKRRKRKFEQPSDDEKDDESGKKDATSETRVPKNARFACPLHKQNPEKFCVNAMHGIKYRACEGPGFTSIAQVKSD